MVVKNKIEIRVVSLVTSVERRASISRILENCEISWQFFDALTVNSEHWLKQDDQRQRTRFGRLLTPGEIGCFKSHAKIWREIAGDNTIDWVLVLEDDVLWDASFNISEAAEYCSKLGINLIGLFVKRLQPFDVVDLFGERQLVRFRTDPYGTQAYLINRAGAQKLISTVEYMDRPVDDELGRFWLHGLELFALFPFPAIEANQISTLRDGRDAGNKNRRHNLKRYIHRAIDKSLKFTANTKAILFGLYSMRNMSRSIHCKK